MNIFKQILGIHLGKGFLVAHNKSSTFIVVMLIRDSLLNVFIIDPSYTQFSDLTCVLVAYLLIVVLASHKKAGVTYVLLPSVSA